MDIDCVIIGVNAASTLAACIGSVLESRYTRGKIHTCYVDGGSTDNSLELARAFPELHIIELHPEYPTPGLGRNAGWMAGKSPMVQFLDSDTVLDPEWLEKAADAMENDSELGAVRGNLHERHPKATVFNWIGNLEWNAMPGPCDAFGGNVLVRRSILKETGGYDDVMIAGEDPELSRRMRLLGWNILHLDTPMCSHDLAMKRFEQYWRRGYRTGYGYADVTSCFGLSDKGFWIHELLRILVRGGGCVGLGLFAFALSALNPLFLFLLFPGVGLLFYPFLFSISNLMKEKKLSKGKAQIYALHCSIVVLPEFFGILRFFTGKLFNSPLKNKRSILKTRDSS